MCYNAIVDYGSTIVNGGVNMTNTAYLRSIIVKNGIKQDELARKIGISPTTFSYKMNNKQDFKASEIKGLCEILKIDNVKEIFLADM